MDLVGLLKKNEQPLRNCCVVVGALQRPDALTLSVGVPLSALNAQFDVLKKVFRFARVIRDLISEPRRHVCALFHIRHSEMRGCYQPPMAVAGIAPASGRY